MTSSPHTSRVFVALATLACACGGNPITQVGDLGMDTATGGVGTGGVQDPCASAGACSSTGGIGLFPSTGGAVGAGGTVGGDGGSPPIGLSNIPFTDGWVDAASNVFGIQGAFFTAADDTTSVSLSGDFFGSTACMSGIGARVDMTCTPPQSVDSCYGVYWGAILGMNLNQPIDPITGQGVDPALPYDASALAGFSFTLTGNVPANMRFQVENADGQYCTTTAVQLFEGVNTVFFEDLHKECWFGGGETPNTASLVRIAWAVVTNDLAEVPFDFCVSDLSAIPR